MHATISLRASAPFQDIHGFTTPIGGHWRWTNTLNKVAYSLATITLTACRPRELAQLLVPETWCCHVANLANPGASLSCPERASRVFFPV